MDEFVVRDWTEIQSYNVYPWSIAGLETCVVIKRDDITLAFDMGYSCHQSLQCDHVLISHGHMDHISAMPNHAAKRGLRRQKPSTYYIPDHLRHNLMEGIRIFCRISEAKTEYGNTKVVQVYPQQRFQLQRGYSAVPFPTVHRVPNLGYILYKKIKDLKPELKGCSHLEIKEMIRRGKDIHDIVDVPEIAYTGDTTFEVFENPPTEDLLRVKLLITEVTYIHDEPGKDMATEARKRGHVHLSDITKNAHLFANVGAILMIHFSDQYSSQQIQGNVFTSLPSCLQGKVYVATLAKEKQ